MLNIKDHMAKLTHEQRVKLLERINLNKPKILSTGEIRPLSRDSNVNVFPLSFSQQGLWFLEQLEGSSSTYNIPFALKLKGKLNKDILAKCFNKIIQRHEILRTSFKIINEEPSQVIINKVQIDIEYVSVSETNIQNYITTEAHNHFSLSEAPLLRIKLLNISDSEHILLITMHHIISDGWSTGIILQELTQLYSAYRGNYEISLPAMPIQYADFTMWQRSCLSDDRLELLFNYWKIQLKDLPPLLELPTDFPRPVVNSYKGYNYKFLINKQLYEQLIDLSNKEGVTLFMSALAAFYILLAKYTNQYDLSVGTTTANRNKVEVENLIGYFVNSLVLRTKFSADQTFRDLLSNVKDTTLSAYAHQDLPFDQIVKMLQPERSLAYHPLFQIMFEMQNAPLVEMKLDDLDITVIEQNLLASKFDLTLSLEDNSNGLEGSIEFNTDIFTISTIEQFAMHYQILLKNIITDPDRKITDLSILSEEEKHHLIVEINQTDVLFPIDKCFQQLFEEQVKKEPDRIAASCDGVSITYIQLDQKANQLAHYLIKHGAKTNSCIALLIDRSINYLIAMLGVFKAGVAFVPLDTNTQNSRTQVIIEQCNPVLLISSDQYLEEAKILISDSKVLCIESILSQSLPLTPPCITYYPNSLAYVIYTSGSTGKPKGAMLEHKGMINHLYGKIHDLEITKDDVIGQIATQTFDVAVWQFICALLVGGRTAIFNGDSSWEPKLLLKKIKTERVTILESVPSHTKVVLDEQESSSYVYDIGTLRTYIINGEPLTPELCARWFKNNPDITLVNAYGATECSDDSHHFHMSSAPLIDMAYVPVKQPLPNQQTYILDDMLELVPVGVKGQIYFGGLGVGRGYLNDPLKTALSFLPNPFSNNHGDRLYKTGDIARYKKDGTIEFLGRSDFQVKIRGFRIEIGEIESVLMDHTSIDSCVVMNRVNQLNVEYLVAYLIPKSYPAPTLSDIQRYCASKLPEYMVPECMIFLDEFPLSSNGKVNRKELPIPNEHDFNLETEYVAPRNNLERKIATLWSKILGREKIGVYDNFFRIGGHSLLAAELAIKLQDELNTKFELRKLFELPTIDLFSKFIKSNLVNNEIRDSSSHISTEISSVRKFKDKDYYELAPCQIPEWYAYQLDNTSPVYNISFNDLFFIKLNLNVFIDAWQLILDRHHNFRIYFDYVDGRPIQKLMPHITLKRDKVLLDYSTIDPNQVDEIANQLAFEYSNKAFDFEHGPLFTFKIVSYPDNQYQLLFVIHHIIWDETSTINLFQELAEVYNSLLENRKPNLSDLKLTYFDYVEWMNESIYSGGFDIHKQYWLNLYKDLPPTLDLPVDYPRPAVLTFNGDSISSWFPRHLVRKLNLYLEKSNVTLFMFMMAIIDLYFFRITGQDDIVIGSPIAGRDHEFFKNILGLFATPMPIRCQLDDKMTFSDLLGHVKQRSLEAFEHHYYPSNLVIEALEHVKDLSRPKLFSVMYGVQNNKTQLYNSINFSEAECFFKNLYGAESNSARFDLTLVVDQWGSDISFSCIYNKDIFKKSTVEKMINEMLYLTEEVIDNSNLPITQYNFVENHELVQLLENYNQTELSHPDTLIHKMFEDQVKRSPNTTAVIFGKYAISYSQLNVATNQLAHYLTNQGVKPNQPVGVLLQPSPNTIITLLAILKISSHYVPISVEYPINRIEYIISHANIGYLIVDKSSKTKLSSYKGKLIDLDNSIDAEAISIQPRENFDSKEVNSKTTAYIIYTSGTTGQPKGIPISHDGVVNLLYSTQSDYGLSDKDSIIFLTPFTFDASILEIFWPTAFGATIVIPQVSEYKDVVKICNLITENCISIFQCVPIMLEAIIDSGFSLPSLRVVISGGAALSRTLRDKFFTKFNCKLFNHYGPTEVTVDASRFDCSLDFYGDVVPIGRPIANAKVFILDKYLNPVTKGVIGELYVSSPGLTDGYINDTEKTTAGFVYKIFDNKEYRLYKTGDLGKLLDDMNIYYIGRTDKQVKIKGNRVELEEIESALLQHSRVRKVVVRYFKQNLTDGQLVSYIEFNDDTNSIYVGNERYQIFTISQRPEIITAFHLVHNVAWPAYFEASEVLKVYWSRLYGEFPEYQFGLFTDNDELAAVGNTVPIVWDGNIDTIPTGWDDALEGVFTKNSEVAPNALLILAGIVTSEFQGKGLSVELLKTFKIMAKAHNLERIIVAVRPTGKTQNQDVDFTTWCSMRRDDGELTDNWLRMHERVGGKILKVALKSQLVEASVTEWEQWSQQKIMSSGQLLFKDVLQPVEIDIGNNKGIYYDPAVWVEHYLNADDISTYKYEDKNSFRNYLNASLPAYMIPDIYYFLPKLPLLESGKINEKALPVPIVSTRLAIKVAPKTNLQKGLISIWSNILEVKELGVTDDFFELGGQSLKAVRLLALVAEKYGLKIPLCKFYLKPTVLGLEEVINSD